MDIRANFCFPPKTSHFQQEIRWNTFCTYWCELMRLEAFLSSSSERQTHIVDSIKWNVIVIPYCSLWICIMYVLQLFNRSVWLFIQISDQRTGLTLSFYIQVDSVVFEYYTKVIKIPLKHIIVSAISHAHQSYCRKRFVCVQCLCLHHQWWSIIHQFAF